MPEASALGPPRGMVRGRRREEGSRWGTGVYLWRIHVDIWQNQYNIVKLKKKDTGQRISLLISFRYLRPKGFYLVILFERLFYKLKLLHMFSKLN